MTGSATSADAGAAPRDAGHGGPGEVAKTGPIPRLVLVLAAAIGGLSTLAQVARALVIVDDVEMRLWYVGLGSLATALFVLAITRPPRSRLAMHALLVVQCLVVVALVVLSRGTEVDFLTALFIPLASEAAVVFSGRVVWVWIGVVVALSTVVPLFGGLLAGLAQAALSVALEVMFVAYIVVARDLEAARRQSQMMLDDLRVANTKLEDYAARAGDLAAVAERDRVARDLNESVAVRIGCVMDAAAQARRVLEAVPECVPAAEPVTAVQGSEAAEQADEAAALLAAIQAETQQALADMRGLIAELRPHLPA